MAEPASVVASRWPWPGPAPTSALPAAAPIISNLSAGATFALVLGGVLYSVGALCYAKRWPDPSPRFFGYHEVFHTLVIAGSITHFTLVAAYVFHL